MFIFLYLLFGWNYFCVWCEVRDDVSPISSYDSPITQHHCFDEGRCWGQNSGPRGCYASDLPLSHTPSSNWYHHLETFKLCLQFCVVAFIINHTIICFWILCSVLWSRGFFLWYYLILLTAYHLFLTRLCHFGLWMSLISVIWLNLNFYKLTLTIVIFLKGSFIKAFIFVVIVDVFGQILCFPFWSISCFLSLSIF